MPASYGDAPTKTEKKAEKAPKRTSGEKQPKGKKGGKRARTAG